MVSGEVYSLGRCDVCVEVWSFGGLGGVVCSVPPPPPSPSPSPRVYVGGGIKEETPCSMYTCVAVLDHNHTV